MKIILASTSKQRQDILNMIGLKYEVLTSQAEEKSNENVPSKYVEELSMNKANSVLNQINEKAIIIACDTIICCENKIYEKPKNKEESYNNLKELSGKINEAYTGMTIIDLYQNKTITSCCKTKVYFRKICDEEINWYVENEPKILNCCGYVPLGKASIFIDKIEGDFNNLLGLSTSVIFTELKKLGYKISDFEFDK